MSVWSLNKKDNNYKLKYLMDTKMYKIYNKLKIHITKQIEKMIRPWTKYKVK